ncbi:MAG: UvrD-helicase domain-containing protein, partial [Defluviitaleaceae bacterium]|nr:UvrD-helicase domain-containing protein [Defluviitaleaceae bacterium]
MVKFSKNQLEAIQYNSTDVLVSAGAGSGKTTVLTERVMHLVAKEKLIDIDKLLILTFTKDAAANMRKKIFNALNKELKKTPLDENLNRQIALSNKANITTIHSFCIKIAREFFHKIDMDPNFRIADETELETIKNNILEELFDENYEGFYKDGQNADFVGLANLFDAKAGDDSFRKAVLKLHEFSRSTPDPAAWLQSCADQYKLDGNIENNPWYAYLTKHLQQEAGHVLGKASMALSSAQALADSPCPKPKALEIIQKEFDQIKNMQSSANAGLDDFHHALDIEFKTLRFESSKNIIWSEEEADIREDIKSTRNAYKEDIKSLQAIFKKDISSLFEDIKSNHPAAHALASLVLEFSKRFQGIKKERGIADFADAEHFCLQILLDDPGDENSPLTPEAYEVGSRFGQIFIDEYQDSSIIQELILKTIAEACHARRFMVGDIKQSIYQFRLASPQIFVDKDIAFNQDASLGRVISLMENFRSRKEVIGSINQLFDGLMSPLVGGVEYTKGHALEVGNKGFLETGQDYRTVIDIIDAEAEEEGYGDDDKTDAEGLLEDITAAEKEAKAVASHIAKLFEEDFQVMGDEGLRKIRYADIVILLRSRGKLPAIFAEILKKYHIPSLSKEGGGFFDAPEVAVITSILKIIDNPHQDIPLITALFSDAFKISNEDLLQIAKYRPENSSFYDAVASFAKAKGDHTGIAFFLQTLKLWRQEAAFTPAS